MAESTRMLLGLSLGIITMIILVAKTKVHSFIAMLLAALITGIIGGMPIVTVKAADGKTIFVSTHDPELIALCCDKIIRITEGRAQEVG